MISPYGNVNETASTGGIPAHWYFQSQLPAARPCTVMLRALVVAVSQDVAVQPVMLEL
jgi:hypothetical protein